jgi:MFS family permease
MIGNGIAPIALAFAVLDLTGSVADLGLIVGLRSLGNFMILFVAGVVADRLPRSLVLQGTSVASFVTQGLCAALFISGHATVITIAALSFLNGVSAAFAFPASSALVPQTVSPEQLQPANALLRLCMNIAAGVSASLAGVLVAVIGSGWCLAIDALTFLFAAFFFNRLKVPASAEAASADTPWAEFRSGWRLVRTHRWIWATVMGAAVINAAFHGVIPILGPLVADESFGREAWGLVMGTQILGLIVAGAVVSRLRVVLTLSTGTLWLIALSLTPLSLALSAELAVVMACVVAAGIGLEIFGVSWDTAMQSRIPQESLGKVYSFDAIGSLAVVPVAQVAIGALAAAFSPYDVLLGAGALMVVCCVLIRVAIAEDQSPSRTRVAEEVA